MPNGGPRFYPQSPLEQISGAARGFSESVLPWVQYRFEQHQALAERLRQRQLQAEALQREKNVAAFNAMMQLAQSGQAAGRAPDPALFSQLRPTAGALGVPISPGAFEPTQSTRVQETLNQMVRERLARDPAFQERATESFIAPKYDPLAQALRSVQTEEALAKTEKTRAETQKIQAELPAVGSVAGVKALADLQKTYSETQTEIDSITTRLSDLFKNIGLIPPDRRQMIQDEIDTLLSRRNRRLTDLSKTSTQIQRIRQTLPGYPQPPAAGSPQAPLSPPSLSQTIPTLPPMAPEGTRAIGQGTDAGKEFIRRGGKWVRVK